ncbi:MAG: CBS domain-containing protein [Bacteroidota bacterium]
MFAKDLTDDTILPVKTSDTGALALTMMDEYKVSHLPIVNNTDFLGLITEDDIYTNNHFDDPLGTHILSLNRPFVNENQHVFEVVKIFAELELTLLPVVDAKENYLGVISKRKLIEEFSEITAVKSPGAILVLEISVNDYSLSEIAQIVESNDTKILSTYITSHPDSTKMDVTLKLNRNDIAPVLQTFNRYNYIVKGIYAEPEVSDDLNERFDALMKYLSI